MRAIGTMAGVLALILGLSSRAAAQVGVAPTPYPPPGPPVAAQAGAPNPNYAAPARPLFLPYNPSGAPPPGYHLEETPRKGLIVAGALTLGIPYLISLTIGGASRNPADRWLLLPVVGPVGTLTYGTRNCDRDTDALKCSANILIVVGLAFDLAAQTAGAILFTMGYVFPKKQWVNDYEMGGRPPRAFAWTVLPRVDASGNVGLTFAGTLY